MDKNIDKLVVKHNKLIEFKGRMTTNELKLFSLIIACVREQQEEQFKEYRIDTTTLKETTKDKNFYNYICDVAFKLEEKRIIVERINDENQKERTSIRLINKPHIIKNSTYLGLYIDKDLIPYIMNLKREFTRYQIENILMLKSSYSVRVYELLKQYQSIGQRRFEIDNLRDYLGIEENEYTRFTNFESRVLKVAKKEINDHTDINMDYHKNKKGRRINSITFKIESKNDNSYITYLDQHYNIKEFKEKSGLSNENFDSKQIIELYTIASEKLEDEYEIEDDLFEYIRINYLHMKKNKTVKNKYAYLKKALDEDFAVARGQIKLDYRLD